MPLDSRTVETLSADDLLLKRRRLVRELRATESLRELRIAVLGGTTPSELVDFLEIHLLANGFDPVFYQSDYGRYHEDAVHDSARLVAFRPELIYIYTCYRNVLSCPTVPATEEDHQRHLQRELERFRQIWQSLHDQIGCQIIQNNFELPPYALLGNLDAVSPGGLTRFYLALNAAFAREAEANPRLTLQDVHTLSAQLGLAHWFDSER